MKPTTAPGLLWMGAMDSQVGGPGGIVVANGHVFVNSGYQPWGPRYQPGNVLFAFEVGTCAAPCPTTF